MRKPLIVRAGFQWFSFVRRQGASRLKLWLISFIETLTYHSARVIIHTTQQDTDFVRKRYRVDANKLHVIPNYVDTDLFKPINVRKQPQTVCFVGRLEEQKNVRSLMEAMSGVNATLILYGDGSLKYELEELAHTLHVNAQFRGRVANEDLPAALNACEVFVLPSLYEGNPKVLLEAMACGLPVVGTNVEGITSIIENGVTGILSETDAHSLGESLHDLLQNHPWQSHLGIKAREKILATNSLHQTISREVMLTTTL